jgi:Gas vesicle protein K
VSGAPEDKLLTTPPDLDPFVRDVDRADTAAWRRIHADPENVERGLAQLVLTVVELLRQLMERQALRRVEAGGLDEETVERLGRTLMALEQRMEELKRTFELRDEDLNLNLGPLGWLLQPGPSERPRRPRGDG